MNFLAKATVGATMPRNQGAEGLMENGRNAEKAGSSVEDSPMWRVGARLHDGPLQSLVAALWALDLADDGVVPATEIDAVRARVKEAVDAMSSLIHRLQSVEPNAAID